MIEFLGERIELHKRLLPQPLTRCGEDFGDVGELYEKFNQLKLKLIEQQEKLSKLDIVEWHQSTGKDDSSTPGVGIIFSGLVQLFKFSDLVEKARFNFSSFLRKYSPVQLFYFSESIFDLGSTFQLF